MKMRVLVYVFVFLVCFFMCTQDAFAGSITIEKDFFTDLYVTKTVNGVTYSSQARRYVVEGQTSYCIEPGTELYSTGYSKTNNFLSYGFNDEKIDYFELVSYFGYDYPGHQNKYYYAAAQDIMWSMLGAKNIKWTTKTNGTGSVVNLTSYKEEILNLINTFNTYPSFNGAMAEGHTGENLILYDENSVINNYKLKSNIIHDININDSELTIGLNNNYIGEFTASFGWDIKDGLDSVLYYRSNSQTIAAFHPSYNKEISILIKSYGGQLNIFKKGVGITKFGDDFEIELSDVKFELYDKDNNFICYLVTDTNGNVLTEEIPYGDYYLLETKAPDGYITNNEKIYITIDEQLEKIELENKLISKKIVLIKKYGYKEYNDYKFEDGAEFVIYDKGGEYVSKIITNEYGEAYINLPYGEYLFKQIKSKNEYKMVDDFYVQVFNCEDTTIELVDEGLLKLPQTYEEGNGKINIIGGLLFVVCLFGVGKVEKRLTI